MPTAACCIDSPVGTLTLAASTAGLMVLRWGDRRADDDLFHVPDDASHPVLAHAVREVEEYFARARMAFSVPLDLRGTPFQQAVWGRLQEIPYGTTTTYGALARALGSPGRAQAVGLANAHNPVGLIVPCHRVIGRSGALTGFAGGLDVKAYLLEFERGPDAAPAFAPQGSLFASP